MAKIGLLLPRYCKVTETDNNGVITETLGTGKVFAKAIKANLNISTSDTKLHADDAVAESVKNFISGTMAFEADDIDDEVSTEIHGETLDTDANDIISSDTDVAPYLRFGFIVRKVKKNVLYYVGIVLMKTQFALPNEEYETKGENIVYKSTTETADFMRNSVGIWRRRKTCDTLSAATTYINGLTNVATGD